MIFPVLALLLAAGAAQAQFATQRSSANGVTVAVTPINLAAGAKSWDFTVVLDTHSQDLSDDLVKSAVLLDDKGNQFKALAWEGAGPGGHHRKGVLKFNPVAPPPQALELRISRPGEAKARIFRWGLK
ncbi:MAG TPA: hypothetical protein VLF42_02530 [Burkholderiales bacterium]|nr:hypothetical protein [Burkholderiales bacterium]